MKKKIILAASALALAATLNTPPAAAQQRRQQETQPIEGGVIRNDEGEVVDRAFTINPGVGRYPAPGMGGRGRSGSPYYDGADKPGHPASEPGSLALSDEERSFLLGVLEDSKEPAQRAAELDYADLAKAAGSSSRKLAKEAEKFLRHKYRRIVQERDARSCFVKNDADVIAASIVNRLMLATADRPDVAAWTTVIYRANLLGIAWGRLGGLRTDPTATDKLDPLVQLSGGDQLRASRLIGRKTSMGCGLVRAGFPEVYNPGYAGFFWNPRYGGAFWANGSYFRWW